MCGFFPVAFLADSIGVGEIVLLFLVILVFFGPRRLPDMARQMGRMVAELRRASQNFRDQVMQMAEEPPASTAPLPPAETGTAPLTAGESAPPIPVPGAPAPAADSIESPTVAATPDVERPEGEPHDRAG